MFDRPYPFLGADGNARIQISETLAPMLLNDLKADGFDSRISVKNMKYALRDFEAKIAVIDSNGTMDSVRKFLRQRPN